MTTRIVTSMVALFLFVTIGVQAQDAPTAASLYNQGLEKAKAKAYDEALDLMEQAIKTADPETDAKVIKLANRNGARAAYGVGFKKRKAKDFEGAIAAYKRGTEMNPNYVGNFKGLAQALEGSGEKAAAVKAYIEAGQLAEKGEKTAKNAPALFGKAENIVAVAYGKKKFTDAISYAEAHLELKETADVHYYLAASLLKKGQADKAKAHIDKAIELGADDVSKYQFTKGEIHEKLGEKDAAVAAYNAVGTGEYKDRAAYQVKQLTGGK
ncbi:MAG: tetratricopeptide repeat protein [Bacteroidota bacterium]